MYIDTHLDAFYHMVQYHRSFQGDNNFDNDNVHVNLPKARKGELLAGFFTGFPNCTYFFSPQNPYPASYKMTRDDYSDAELTEEYLARWLKIVNDPVNSLIQLKTKRELEKHINSYNPTSQNTKIGAILHFEGAAGIDAALNRLYIFYGAGLRSIGLTWNETNQFATGVPGDVNRGLTTSGKDLLDAMETLGIIVDVSHLNDKSFWDVQSHTNKSLLASHSNIRKRANSMRNLTDEMIKAIADSGGSIGINFCQGFLSTDKEHKVNRNCAFEMIKEIINITGSVEHIHIGSDFDGCKIPNDIKDVSTMPDFFQSLQNYLELTKEEIKKIQFGNMLRIINEHWKE